MDLKTFITAVFCLPDDFVCDRRSIGMMKGGGCGKPKQFPEEGRGRTEELGSPAEFLRFGGCDPGTLVLGQHPALAELPVDVGQVGADSVDLPL